MTLTFVALCVALVPACLSWWSGRRLHRPDGSLVLWADWTRPLIVRPRQHLAVELEDDAIPVALSAAGRGGLVSFVSAGAHSDQIRVLELR